MLKRIKKAVIKRVEICSNESLIHPLEIKDPINLLISEYSEINIFFKLNKPIFKFLYFNKNKIHEILYNSEEIIDVNNQLRDDDIKLMDIFYLSLLINDNIDIINYKYSIECIRNINNMQKYNNNIIKKILFAKIIIDLLNNYKGTDDYDVEMNIKEINEIASYNKMIIKNDIRKIDGISFNLNEKEILSKNVDELYAKIIIFLIKEDKFNDDEFIYNIINQLDLDNINITKLMIEKISNVLDINNNYMNNYIIKKIEDLYNIKKLNFNYYLLKYILKSPFYIYNVPFLFETRKIIINIINLKLEQLLPLKTKDNIIINKIEYLLKKLSDSEYYFNKYLKYSIIDPLKEILQYYNEFLFESKKDDIQTIKEILTNNKIEKKPENILKDFEFAKKMNNRFPVIKYLYRTIINNKNIEKSEEEFNKCVNEWMLLEKMINKKSFKKITKNTKIILINYFNDINNKDILLKIFSEEAYDFFIQKNIYLLNDKEVNILNSNKDNQIIQTNVSKNDRDINWCVQSKINKNITNLSKLILVKLIFQKL